MGEILIPICITLEAVFFAIGIKAIRPKCNTLLLLLGIIAINLVAGYSMMLHITKYILIIASTHGLVMLLDNDSKVYDIFMLSAITLIKFIMEFVAFFVVLQGQYGINEITVTLIIFIGIISLLYIPIRRIYKKIASLWNASEAFYLRYILLLVSIFTVFVSMYNIIAFKEVV